MSLTDIELTIIKRVNNIIIMNKEIFEKKKEEVERSVERCVKKKQKDKR